MRNIDNIYLKNLNRIEFVVTLACTGRCKHCSEGDHMVCGEHIDGDIGAEVVRKVAGEFDIKSLMTFGGEPLLYVDDVCKIHNVAKEVGILERQLITNGYFSKNKDRINSVAHRLSESGVNDILLSVDAFHQETIPLEPVMEFAKACLDTNMIIRTQPAWLVSCENDNPYNKRTEEILREFADLGIEANEGNVIFPSGNALKYLAEYFDGETDQFNPYVEDPTDVHAICISQDGNLLGCNIYNENIIDILQKYKPERF